MLEPWYQLSKDEREELRAQREKTLEQVGGKQLILCDSLWSSNVRVCGVNEYPDIEAEQKHTQLLEELNWSRYAEVEILLGTEWQPS